MVYHNKMKKKKNQKKNNPWILILDKLLIGAIIVILTSILNGRNATNQSLLESNLNLKADNLEHIHNKEIAKLTSNLKSTQIELKSKKDSLLEKYKQESNLKSQLAQLKERFGYELKEIWQKFKYDSVLVRKEVKAANDKETYKARLEFVSSQLRDFYWPIKIRLEKNNAVYRLLGNKFVGSRIDSEVILPNHLEIINIIEKKIYLAQADDELSSEIFNYVGHVYMYQALRRNGYEGFPNEYKGNNYRETFYKIISDKTSQFQKKYVDLIKLVYQDSSKTDDNSIISHSNISTIPNDITQTDSFSLDYQQKKFEMKLAYNKKSYIDTLRDTVMIAFKRYIKDADFCIFQIGKYDQKPKYKSFRKDENKKLLIEEFSLEEGKSHLYKSQVAILVRFVPPISVWFVPLISV